MPNDDGDRGETPSQLQYICYVHMCIAWPVMGSYEELSLTMSNRCSYHGAQVSAPVGSPLG